MVFYTWVTTNEKIEWSLRLLNIKFIQCVEAKILIHSQNFCNTKFEKQNEIKARLEHDDVSEESKFCTRCCFKLCIQFRDFRWEFIVFLISTFYFRLLPISIVWTSAGTIRAVPDTVKKVPGLAPVLFSLLFHLPHCFLSLNYYQEIVSDNLYEFIVV